MHGKSHTGEGGSKMGNFMKQKSPNQLCWLNNNKTNKAQAGKGGIGSENNSS